MISIFSRKLLSLLESCVYNTQLHIIFGKLLYMKFQATEIKTHAYTTELK